MNRATMQAKEAARYLGLSYWKLLELAKAGKVPHIRLPGRILFRRESLDNWLKDQEQASMRQKPVQVGKIRRIGL